MADEEREVFKIFERIADSLENLVLLTALQVQRGASKSTYEMATKVLERVKEQQEKRV